MSVEFFVDQYPFGRYSRGQLSKATGAFVGNPGVMIDEGTWPIPPPEKTREAHQEIWTLLKTVGTESSCHVDSVGAQVSFRAEIQSPPNPISIRRRTYRCARGC
jgi:hypothetical protein